MSGGVTEPEARALVARSGRVLERIGQGDLAWGHTSARDAEGRGVWTKPAGAGFDEVQDDDVILIGWEGEVLVGDGPRHVEFHIHTEIMRARPDVNGIVHTHPVHAIALAATGQPLAPLSHEGCQFVPPDIARFTATTDVINSRERGEQLVDALSDRNAALMIGHGIVTVGSSLGTAVGAAYHLERACQIQLLAGQNAMASTPEEAVAKRTRSKDRFYHAWTYLDRATNG
jgi:L-fuculose-phosphate aldolase